MKLPPRLLAAALAIAAAIVLAYANSLSGTAILDDHAEILDNASLHSLRTALFPPPEAGTAGRPLANFTLGLNYAISGLDLRSYHVANLAIHVLAALVLFGVVRRTLLLPTIPEQFLRVALPLATAVALLWALHPVQTIAVSYLAQRTEVLMALFYLLTLYAFIRSAEKNSRGWQLLTVLACAAGLACKETMVTAPVALLLYDRAFLAGNFRDAFRQRRWLYAGLAATWVWLAFLMQHAALDRRGIGFGLGVSWFDYVLGETRALVHYVRLSVWPSPLVFDHGWAYPQNLRAVLPSALGCIALVSAALVMLWRRPKLGFCLVWFLLLLAPTTSIVPLVEQPIAENRMYLPLAGAMTCVALGIFSFAGRFALGASVLLALVFGGLTRARNFDYRSALALYTDNVAKQPANARAHGVLAEAMLEANHAPDAIAEARRAIEIRPAYAEAHNTLGAALAASGRLDEAIAQYRAALALQPELAEAHYNLGSALAASGRPADAVASFEAALRFRPDRATTHNNLGVVLLQLGRVPEAIRHDELATKLAPESSDAHYNFANALAAASRPDEAIAEFSAALRLRPDFDKAHNNLGSVLLTQRRVLEAIAHFEAALKINPDYALARANLARAVQLQTSAPPL